MDLILTLVSGACWTWVYIAAIRIGLTRKTYAIPAFALGLNLAWEFIYTYLGFTRHVLDPVQTYVNACWATFDVLVVYTYLRYGRRYWPGELPPATFWAWSALLFAVGFVLQVLFVREFGSELGARYSAFLQNLLMSVLFIDMFVRRRGPEGQSLVIAVNKWIGTLAPTILYGWMEHRPFILAIGALCSVYDLLYVGLLLGANRIWPGRD